MTAPFVLDSPPVDRWNDLVVGGAIVTLAGYSYSRERVHGGPDQRVSGILGLLGGWLLFAPFANGVTGNPLWNDVIVGVLVTAFAGYNAFVTRFAERTAPRSSADET